jgi:hypothetical protein
MRVLHTEAGRNTTECNRHHRPQPTLRGLAEHTGENIRDAITAGVRPRLLLDLLPGQVTQSDIK